LNPKKIIKDTIMGKQQKNAVSPSRAEDYPEWYQQVIKASDMAERSPVRGCMVIKPWGYALWENIVAQMDRHVQGHRREKRLFPSLFPSISWKKRPSMWKVCQRMCCGHPSPTGKGPQGGLVPGGRLTEPLVVRPTSETIIGDSFSKWINSYRDLPLLINQWANVVRWEMRTRIFLRTSEFLWQEGHTAHATDTEAIERTRMMLDVYTRMVRRTIWPYRSSRATRRRRSAFPVPSTPCASKP
jgi:prolyl-tRNA synthetase